jgi:1-aminocyclopropane-1-carboxylate deaminase
MPRINLVIIRAIREIRGSLLFFKQIPLMVIQSFAANPQISLLRLDLPKLISGGNKRFKLRYNIVAMREEGKNSMLSFGGAFSNHIAALALAGKYENIQTIGIIRGEELNADSNDVLRFATSCGMLLYFVSREEYRLRNTPDYIHSLQQKFSNAYLIPEGGSNFHAVKGCAEILSAETDFADIIVVPVGTGATVAGIISSAKKNQRVIGIAVLKGKTYLENEINGLLTKYPHECEWELNDQYHFDGYGKTNDLLRAFIVEMRSKHNLPLDAVYSGKCFFAANELAKTHPDKQILFVHTGGYAFSNIAD